MRVEKVGCWRTRADRPMSCREKFLRAWYEKLRYQSCPSSPPQLPNSQPPSSIPAQGRHRPRPLSPSRTLPQSSCGRADSFMGAMPTQEEHSGSLPAVCVGPPDCSQQTSGTPGGVYPCDRDRSPLGKELVTLPLDQEEEDGEEEEFLQICISDLLLKASPRKRPRLLPPNRKMHIEVRNKRAKLHQAEEGQNSSIPLEYSHLVDTMAMTKPADLSKAESFYQKFASRPRRQGFHISTRDSPVQTDGTAPAGATEGPAHHWNSFKGMAGSNCKSQPKNNRKRGISALTMFASQHRDADWREHLPPKKRYIHC